MSESINTFAIASAFVIIVVSMTIITMIVIVNSKDKPAYNTTYTEGKEDRKSAKSKTQKGKSSPEDKKTQKNQSKSTKKE